MSTEDIDENEFRLTINTSSPEAATSILPQAFDPNLNRVASSTTDYLDNLEPELAKVSQSAAGHAAIAPAPMSQAQQRQSCNTSSVSLAPYPGPVSLNPAIGTAPADAAERLPVQPHKGPKAKRLGRACDACSRRKVKCDHARPCKNCEDLNLECTFQRPAKRRGPVNRIAEELKKRKQVSEPDDTTIDTALTSPERDNTNTPVHFVSAELLGSFDAIKQFAELFFLYVYPLYPFPHEHEFVRDIESRSDIQNPQFVALIASMVGITAVSLPRLAQEICTEHDLVFDRMVDLCLKVATDLRGAQFVLRAECSITEAITSFFLGLTASRTKRKSACRLFWAETAAMLQLMREEHLNQPSSNDSGSMQIARRLSSALFVESQILREVASDTETRLLSYPYPEEAFLPEELDDEHISAAKLGSQPASKTSIPTTLVMLAKIYHAYVQSENMPADSLDDELMNALIKPMAQIKEMILAAPACLTSPFTPAVPKSKALANTADRATARLDVQKVTVQLTALTCRMRAAQRLDVMSNEIIRLKYDEEKQLETALMAQTVVNIEFDSIPMELALLLKRIEHGHIESQWSNFSNKMKIMLVSMQEMKDENEDAAYVVQRMADFEQQP